MLHSHHTLRLLMLGAVVAVGLIGSTVAQASTVGTPLITTLKSPRGITPLAGGDVLVAEAGAGHVLKVTPEGTTQNIMTGLPISSTVPSGALEGRGVVDAAPDGNGGYYALVAGPDGSSGFDALYYQSSGAVKNMASDLGAFEDANNSDGAKDANDNPITTSNPFALAVDDLGRAYITDSSANVVLRYSTGGTTSRFFVFPTISNSLFPGQGPQMISQAPTGITIGPDDAIYVATFTAYPYPVGGGRVYRLDDKNFDGDAMDENEATVFATGLTTPTALAFDDKGVLHVAEYSTNLLTKQTGRISKIVNGTPTAEVYALTGPTALALPETGAMLVTEESVGRITDVTGAPATGFSGTVVSGVNIVTYNGGTVSQLTSDAVQVNAISVSVSKNGKLIVLVPGAPSFVNSAFNGTYPISVPKGTVLLIVGK